MKEIKQPVDAVSVAVAASNPGFIERAVDAVLQPLAPGLVARRFEQRQELGFRRAMLMYASTQPNYQRLTGGFSQLTSEDAELPGSSRYQLIADCRDLYRNFLIVRAGVNGVARRTVSTGIGYEPHTDDAKWNLEAKAQWFDFSQNCDIRGMMDMHAASRQIIRSCFYDGDLGIRLCEVDGDLRLQFVEADLIAQDYRSNIGQDTINPIGGVIVDWTTGRPTGYMVGQRGVGGILQNSQFEPASSFLLPFRAQRVDQVRGIPLLAPCIQTARDLDRYLTATRMQANIAATYGVVVKRDMAAQFGLMASRAGGNVLSGAGDNGGTPYRTMPLKTGLMTFLNPGESIESFKPDVPGPQFDQFAKFMVRMLAIGMGTTYEMLMQDYSNMSFSSSRTNLMDMTLTAQEWQRFLIRQFFTPVYRIWVSKRMENGLLPFNEQALTHARWQQPAELGIDPQQNATSNVELIRAGLDTFENQYQQQGHDWKVKLRQKADEVAFIEQLAKEREVQPELISSTLPPGLVMPSMDVGAPGNK